ncbi:MAG: helix-turn-helix domain-containing protein [Vulcanococcus sp.]
MAASRLSDSQKQELVDRYRQGETGQALAQAYGCSPNTVSRVLKAALGAEELASLKRQSRAGGRSQSAATSAEETAADPEQDTASDPQPGLGTGLDHEPTPELAADPQPDEVSLAIDDADDFGDDGLDDGDEDADEPEQSLPVTASASQASVQVVLPRPLGPDSLPGSLYLLVDKTVELDVRPLREFSELGSLPEEEQERQAVMLYVNPRQAKRQCGRSQRVIKVPDSGVLQRTSRYLVAQGITRLVLEGGSLFAIPGG